jgi:hypothetical protein
MHLFTMALVTIALSTRSLAAQEKAAFIIRLGADTTSIERFSRSGSRIELDQVGRVPRVLRRHATMNVGADGAVNGADVLVTRVGAGNDAPPVQHVIATRDGDSMRVEVHVDTTVRRLAAGVPAGAAVPVISPWVLYDGLSMRLRAGKSDSLRLPMYFLTAPTLSWVALRRLGRDSVDIETEFDRYHARVDSQGRILGLRPIKGTQQYSVDRVASADLDVYATAFAARESQDGALGLLSHRDTATATAGGANLWVDYGRPLRRGRTIFGGVVPLGDIWRTGANAATQFRTDKPIAFGSTVVPAGMYTLWTLPTAAGWTLIINGETGQWGTEHHADRDLYRIPLEVRTGGAPVERFTIHIATEGAGGQIHIVWDTIVAAANFTIPQ